MSDPGTTPSGRVPVIGRLRRATPDPAVLRRDAVAGLPGAISSVPDGMAASVLAGVSPIHGLYACVAGAIAGGLTAGTRLMVVTTTSAAALAAGSAIAGLPAGERPGALALLTLLAGVAMIAAGLARLGRWTHFVAHSVMVGFLTGVAANIVLGQLAALVGGDAEGPFALARALDLLANLGTANAASALAGLGAIGILLAAGRTRLASVSAVVALVVPTVALVIAGDDGVVRVRDVGEIPSGVPLPAAPDFGHLSLDLVTGALSVAAIVLIQGAGVREIAPNPAGATSSIDRDFIAQGVGNLASGAFRGQPVGGSVGQTSLNLAAGARTRWAGVFTGVWMLGILVLFSGVVGQVAMPTLAGVLIIAAIGSVRVDQLGTIVNASAQSAVALVTTFLATLLLPIVVAVGIGVALSLLLQLNREAIDLRVVELVRLPGGRFAEHRAPVTLERDGVTVLEAYGSLLFAGARTLQAQLPDPTGAEHPAVVLRLRGRVALGATFVVVVSDYAERLAAIGGRLFLSGVDPHLLDQLQRTAALPGDAAATGPRGVFEAGDVIGESTLQAYEAATRWRAAQAAAHGTGEGSRSAEERAAEPPAG